MNLWNKFIKILKPDKPQEPVTPTSKGDLTWHTHKMRSVTMFIGEMVDSKRAVYVYLDYPLETIRKLIEENEDWFQEEVDSYMRLLTEGAIIHFKPKGRYLAERSKEAA